MRRRCRAHELDLHERLADESARNHAADGQIDAAFEQGFVRAGQHGLDELHARFGPLASELGEAVEQQPGRKDDLDGESHFGLRALSQLGSRTLEPTRLDEQRASAPVEHLAGRRQHRSASLALEHR